MAAELSALKVSRLVPVAGFGVKVADTPLGNPDATRFTLPAKVLLTLTLMVEVAESPRPTVRELGEAPNEMYGI
jgi:hypothetical protein